MERFNTILHKLNNVLLIIILVVIPLGLISATIDANRAMDECPETGTCHTWIGLVYVVLIVAGLYTGLMLLWLKFLQHSQTSLGFRLIQLIIIFLIGVVPGLMLMFPAVFAD